MTLAVERWKVPCVVFWCKDWLGKNPIFASEEHFTQIHPFRMYSSFPKVFLCFWLEQETVEIPLAQFILSFK